MGPKKTHLNPSFWQRHVSPKITWVSHHCLSQPSRKALAGSIREQSESLDPEERKLLANLLVKYQLVQPKFEQLDPLKLQHFHFCPIITGKRIEDFRASFNKTFIENFHISYVAGQFSILSSREAISFPPPSPDEGLNLKQITSKLINKALANTNRPLTFEAIKNECSGVSPENLAYQLGAQVTMGQIITTSSDSSEIRYFSLHRKPDLLRKKVIFEYVNKEGDLEYIHHVEAREMTKQDRAARTLQVNGSIKYFSSQHIKEEEIQITEIKSTKGPLFALPFDIPELILAEQIITGVDGKTSQPCYIDASSQKKFRFEIFSAFVKEYFEGLTNEDLLRLRCAFDAGFKCSRDSSINEFLYEAKNIVRLCNDLEAVYLALLKTPKAAEKLKENPLFSESLTKKFIFRLKRLNSLSQFPLLFTPDWSYSLQNYIHFIYDYCNSYDVFLCLLVNKLAKLRKHEINDTPVPANLKREIEMVYAPLAESKGFIDLANNMRDLVCRLVDFNRYQKAQQKMCNALGMNPIRARRHLLQLGRQLKEDILTAPKLKSKISVQFHERVKEASSLSGKEKLDPKESADFLGIRITSKSIEEAEEIASYLTSASNYELAEHPSGKDSIANHLIEPNENGWLGWRGYFYDPTQKGKAPRIISIQILTKEMEKADKLGEAGHWNYKAERAAQTAAKELGSSYQRQLFDPAPLKQYNGDPRHDFYVDRQHARRYKRIFVLSEDFSPNSFKFPENGIIPILRLSPEDTVADAVASRTFGDKLIKNISFASLYLYKLDSENDTYSFIPYKRGSARAAFEDIPPNNCFLVTKSGDPPDPVKLAELNLKVKKIRTKLLIGLALNAKKGNGKEKLVEKGKKTLSFLDTPEKQNEIIQRAGLRHRGNRNELWMAIALGLIDEDMIRNWLGIFEPSISIDSPGRGRLNLHIKTADRPGLLLEVLSFIENKFSILEARATVNKHPLGFSPANIFLSLKDIEGSDSSINISALQTKLTKLEYKRSQDQQQYSRIKISLPNTRKVENWDILHSLLPIIREKEANIIEINLPNCNGNHPAEIIIETQSAAETFLQELDGILSNFQSDIPNIRAFIT